MNGHKIKDVDKMNLDQKATKQQQQQITITTTKKIHSKVCFTSPLLKEAKKGAHMHTRTYTYVERER